MSQSDEQQIKWNSAWSSMINRELLEWHTDTINSIIGDLFQRFRIVRITIAENPVQYSENVYRPLLICPVCGVETCESDRVPASIYPVFYTEPGCPVCAKVAFGVWVHIQCLNQSPRIDEPSPIPW